MAKSPHRPPDPDLLERFVLNRLDPGERTEVEELVRTSEEWREALQREQILAAGVRRLGRAGIRQQLSERLLVSPQYAIPWPRIALAAAVICIVVGVGIVNRWFVPSPHTDTPAVEQLTDSDKGAEPDQTTPEGLAGKDLAAAVEDEAPPASTSSVDRERREKAEDRVEEELRQPAERDMRETRKVAAPGADAQAPVRPDQSATAAVSEAAPSPAARTTSVIWIQGQLLAAESAGLQKQVAAEPKEAIAQDRRSPAERELGARRKQESGARAEVSQSYSLQQRPFSTLDETRQQRFEQAAPHTIPTLIEQRGDSLYLTLFPDSPFNESEMETATVLPIASDSIVLTVGHQQIGYRLPESFLQAPDGQTKP